QTQIDATSSSEWFLRWRWPRRGRSCRMLKAIRLSLSGPVKHFTGLNTGGRSRRTAPDRLRTASVASDVAWVHTGRRAAPTTVKSSVRTREYLTTAEIERLMAAARKSSRYGHRDATMILIGYRHGLRASELCDLQWSQAELATGRLHVRRAKNGSPSVHPMQGDEIRTLRRLPREQGPSSYVFMPERGGPMTPKAFHALFGRIGARAEMQFPIHPHMLRHGCGYALANAGHDTRALQAWLGHKNIQHTIRYTELAPH